MERIRDEVHTRSKFASKKYYEIVRNFGITNFYIKNNKIEKTFKMLSGIETHQMHIDLERCYKIYCYYREEYNDFLLRNNTLRWKHRDSNNNVTKTD